MNLSFYYLVLALSVVFSLSANVYAEKTTTPTTTVVNTTIAPAATRLAVVQVATLLDESPRAKALAKTIKNQYLQQEQILKKEHEALKQMEASLDRNSDQLSNNERIKKSRDFRQRKRKYTRDYEVFRDQLNTERQDALVTVRQEVLDAITAVREQKKIDIVIENYIDASNKVDITADVIQYLKDNYQKEQTGLPPSVSQNAAKNAVIKGN
jgi:outer membrane protein